MASKYRQLNAFQKITYQTIPYKQKYITPSQITSPQRAQINTQNQTQSSKSRSRTNCHHKKS